MKPYDLNLDDLCLDDVHVFSTGAPIAFDASWIGE